ncbi:lipid-A-disaccharide synthase N-terminal domain-containing protein [Chachezhania antarctica]|uniref:lipid-A-disaccharide synthase N-terminal domain-containing protein n=1 Tax=Chachezhania antarctica TaxID=2340860 RepID=UPI000EB03951|nr:lipid-A-disaccharide synthase N-terminal domain-containing protein [Chachezhania antarctica]|tara:strand:+ start:3451 stop:3759 length:309 start_codon:yes stop_codon:yes gene_type:complete
MIDWLLSVFKVTTTGELIWVAVGLFGQLMFTMRFLLQWIASERQKKSVIPEVFWWFSISGGLILFAYACYRADPVFILGQSFGVVIYARNLWLLYAEKRQNA